VPSVAQDTVYRQDVEIDTGRRDEPLAKFLFSTMNTIERKEKEAERKRKARLLESDEQNRMRLQDKADRTRKYRASLT
jgi:hypothetical protein